MVAFDFPASPSEGQAYSPPGGPGYVYTGGRWKGAASPPPLSDPSNTPFAVWPSGTLRTMKERATDTYCILDAPGSPDPTGVNDSTTALLAMAAEGIKGEITDGTFLCSQQLHLKEGVIWEGHGSPDYLFHAKSKIIFTGTGTKTSLTGGSALVGDFAPQLVLANPSAGEAYLADSGTRGNSYTMLNLNPAFSAAIMLDRAAGIRNLGIYPNFNGVAGYYVQPPASPGAGSQPLSDDWDVGVWANDADCWLIDNCAVAGHWRKAALLVTENNRADDAELPSSQYGRAMNSYFQGFFALSMRSPNVSSGGWGFAGTDFINCEFRPLSYKGAILATSDRLVTPFASPSGCVEMGGYAMRGVQFLHSTFTGHDDICMILGRAGEIVLNGCYSEAKSVYVAGVEVPNSRGFRMIADANTAGVFKANTKYGVDFSPWNTRGSDVTRYTAPGLFNPLQFLDDDIDEIRNNPTIMGARLRSSAQSWGVLSPGAASSGTRVFEVKPTGVAVQTATYSGITPVINDDTAYSLLTSRLGGFCAITYCGHGTSENSAFQSPRFAGIVGFDTGTANINIFKIGGGDLFDVLVGNVTGTTGIDGHVTVGIIDNNLRIENRTGGNSLFRYFFFG